MLAISAAITSVPSRQEHVRNYMLPKLREMRIPTRNSIDIRRQGYNWNNDQAWRMYGAGATHHLVLEDDVQFCDNFAEKIEEAVNARPNDFLSFFHSGARDNFQRALKLGYSWCAQTEAYYCPALLMPVWMIVESLRWSARHVKDIPTHTDVKFSLYLYVTNRLCYYTVPCLVEHLGAGNSVMGHSGSHLVAGKFETTVTADFSREDCVTHHKDLQKYPSYWEDYIP